MRSGAKRVEVSLSRWYPGEVSNAVAVELPGMPERWPLERFVADGEARVFRGPKMLAIFDKDDLGMRNVVAVSLTDAGIPCKDVAQCFGLSVPYISMLRGRRNERGSDLDPRVTRL